MFIRNYDQSAVAKNQPKMEQAFIRGSRNYYMDCFVKAEGKVE